MIYTFALALLAEAGHEASGGILSNPLLWRILNLTVFVAILVYILRNKVGLGRLFDDRAASIRKQLEQSRQEKQEAQDKLAELEARLSRLDDELARIRAEAEREAERETERIRKTAESDAEKIRQMTQREIEGALKAARTELRTFVADNAVHLAETIIRREIRQEDQSRIMNDYVEKLDEVRK